MFDLNERLLEFTSWFKFLLACEKLIVYTIRQVLHAMIMPSFFLLYTWNITCFMDSTVY